MLSNALQFILKRLAQLVLRKYKPIVIGVTGNVGKTTTKEAIYAVLAKKFYCRRSEKSYNNPIGLPLTILGLETKGKSIFGWLVNFAKAINLILFRRKYPKALILEIGADEPGGIKYLVDFAKPKIGVITAIGEIPVHVEFFKNREELITEKSELIKALPEHGLAILNFDSEDVYKMKNISQAPVISYGLDQDANVFASNVLVSDDILNPGISFKLNYNGSAVPVRLTKALGAHQIYPLLAAAAVGVRFNLNLVEIAQAMQEFIPPAGRMRLIKGIKNTLIIDDSYNASPTPVLAALDALEQFQNARKVAALGDMTELGDYTKTAHEQVGKKVGKIVDQLFLVGERSKIIAQAAKEVGLKDENIFQFDNADSAKVFIQNKLKTGDIVLVKGSQAMRMEKIVEEIMAEPQRAKELLVRQDASWKKKK